VIVKAAQSDEVDDSARSRTRPARPPVEPAPEAVKPAAAATGKSPSKAALKARAMADPVVERTMDLFGGILLDVKPLDTPPETPEENGE
jgi:hypothetical protein